MAFRGSIEYSEQQLRATGNPEDATYAEQLRTMLDKRGADIPFPQDVVIVEYRPDAVSEAPTSEAIVTDVVAHIATFPQASILTRASLTEQSGLSAETASKVVKYLLKKRIIEESGDAPRGNRIPGGPSAKQLTRTELFDSYVKAIPEWGREIRLRKLMGATGLSREEVLNQALGLLEADVDTDMDQEASA